MNYSINGVIFDIPEGVTHFKFIKGDTASISISMDLMTITYTSGMNSGELSSELGLDFIYEDQVITPYKKPTKIERSYIGINGDDEFIKICHEDINITQLRYKIEDINIVNKFYNLAILLGTESDWTLDEYYDRVLSTKLFELGTKVTERSSLKNAFIKNSSTHLIKSSRVYLPQSKYRKYRICSLDYINDFIISITPIFENYGFELIEFNKAKDANTKNICLFKIDTHASNQLTRVIPRIPEHSIMYSGCKVSFTLMTSDTDIYEDFRMRYNNIDLIQNHREFACQDKYENWWRYDVIWDDKLDDSFTHEVSPSTELGSYGYQFNFTASLEYFEVYDDIYEFIDEIIITRNVSKDYTNKDLPNYQDMQDIVFKESE